MVMMGCNSGGVKEGEEGKNKFLKSLVNVSNDFLNVFTSFGEMVGSVLGLNVDSKKSDVGKYFKKVQGTVQGIKVGLNKIVSDMKKEKNPNVEATATAVKTLVESKLDKIISGAKTASEAIGNANDLIGNVASAAAGGAVGIGVNELLKGIKDIVEVVLKDEGKHDAGDSNKVEDGNARGANNADGAGKLFGNASSVGADDKKAVADAAKAIGAVTGAGILQAMTKNGDSVKLASVNAAAGAAGATNTKDATIAGGIALRAIAKDGKFANGDNANNVSTAVTIAATSAVTKALDTLTIAIRKIIDVGLKEVKAAMKINANDTIVASEKGGSSGQN
ncbi:Variable outer membrane protein (plasmid) [Borrelia crocidurae DOU]|uniref:Variable large protein n=2 Tax=Borrelia crocidurae TaxID=29520 RepID=W5SMJ4_9SPIR|nr:Variable outer membrane protein [Borrelia crocidurae DOU]